MTTFKNHYAILKVGEHASSDEIKAAYKVQCLRWHPDLNPGANTTGIMQALNEAKEILLDPVKREQYNLEYAQYKKPKANQPPRQPLRTEEQLSRNKLWHDQIKTRVSAFGRKDPFLFEEYSKQIKTKSDSELLFICANWEDYQPKFVDLSAVELYEKRGYPLDRIYQKITAKAASPTTNKVSDFLTWWITWVILAALFRAIAH